MRAGFLAETPKVLAHRGASASAPENTLAAVRLAAGQGAGWVEVDVAVTADGTAVIHHDDRLERCTSGSGWLLAHRYEELSVLDAGSWFAPEFAAERIPTLEALLALAVELDIGLNLEIKPLSGWEEPTAAAMIETLKKWWRERCPLLISSFSPISLRVVRERLANVPRAYNAMVVPPDWEQRLEYAGCIGIHCHGEAQLDPGTVASVKSTGKRMLCFTVNDAAQARRLLGWGVDGVITDHPGRMIQALANL